MQDAAHGSIVVESDEFGRTHQYYMSGDSYTFEIYQEWELVRTTSTGTVIRADGSVEEFSKEVTDELRLVGIGIRSGENTREVPPDRVPDGDQPYRDWSFGFFKGLGIDIGYTEVQSWNGKQRETYLHVKIGAGAGGGLSVTTGVITNYSSTSWGPTWNAQASFMNGSIEANGWSGWHSEGAGIGGLSASASFSAGAYFRLGGN